MDTNTSANSHNEQVSKQRFENAIGVREEDQNVTIGIKMFK
jgi:hypothetical protein